MDGWEYEKACAEYLERNGYHNVTVTQGSGDQGVDIVAEKNGIKHGIQCKYYSGPVGNKAIQEVYAGINVYDCDKAVVMTNSEFTKAATELARATGVELWAGMTLDRILLSNPGTDDMDSKREGAREREPLDLTVGDGFYLFRSEGDGNISIQSRFRQGYDGRISDIKICKRKGRYLKLILPGIGYLSCVGKHEEIEKLHSYLLENGAMPSVDLRNSCLEGCSCLFQLFLWVVFFPFMAIALIWKRQIPLSKKIMVILLSIWVWGWLILALVPLVRHRHLGTPDKAKDSAIEKQADLGEIPSMTWIDLLDNRGRYKFAVERVCENFNQKTVSKKLKKKLTKEEIALVEYLFRYVKVNNDLPDDFKDAFTKFCDKGEYRNLFGSRDEKIIKFCNTLSKAFSVYRDVDEGSHYHVELKTKEDIRREKKFQRRHSIEHGEKEYTFSEDYTVGDVTVHLNKMVLRQESLPAGMKMLEMRLFLRVSNDTEQEQYFLVRNTPRGATGRYHETDDDIRMLPNIVWEKEGMTITDGATVTPHGTEVIVVQAGTPIDHPLKTGDTTSFDIYYYNNDFVYTVTYNLTL